MFYFSFIQDVVERFIFQHKCLRTWRPTKKSKLCSSVWAVKYPILMVSVLWSQWPKKKKKGTNLTILHLTMWHMFGFVVLVPDSSIFNYGFSSKYSMSSIRFIWDFKHEYTEGLTQCILYLCLSGILAFFYEMRNILNLAKALIFFFGNTDLQSSLN